MSANRATPYPHSDAFYAKKAKQHFSIFKLLEANERFQYDVKKVRNEFQDGKILEFFDESFEPKPHYPEINNNKTSSPEIALSKKEIETNARFEKEVSKIAKRISFDGDMQSFVEQYIQYDEEPIYITYIKKKRLYHSIEKDTDNNNYVNLKLYGKVTMHDIEKWWNEIETLISEVNPDSRHLLPQQVKNLDSTWDIYELHRKGLKDADIADLINDKYEDQTTVFTGNTVNKKIKRLQEKIDKAYC